MTTATEKHASLFPLSEMFRTRAGNRRDSRPPLASNRLMRFTIAAALALAIAAPAAAQEREPVQRQTLLDLSYVLGEAHALRQICNGEDDQFWRDRMMSMLSAEDADFNFSERLRGAFNTGFVGRQARHLQCSSEVRQDEALVSARGQALARRLAQGRAPAG